MNRNETTTPWLEHPICKAILTKISDKSPQGKDISDSESFNFLSNEMRKVNTLQHSSIQWDKMEEHGLKIFTKESKHLRVLVALIFCLIHQKQDSSTITSLVSFSLYLKYWWVKGFPLQSNTRSQKQCINMINQLVKAFTSSLSNSLLSQHKEIIIEARDLIIESSYNDPTFEKSNIGSLIKLLKEIPDLEIKKEQEPDKVENKSSKKNIPVLGSREKNTLREQHNELFYFYSKKHPHPHAAWHIRRWKTWYSIDSLPPSDENGVTQLMATPPIDTRQIYMDKKNSPSLDLWEQLEKSLENSPFWLTGHYLSFIYAQSLGKPLIAKLIQEEAILFTKSLPNIIDLSFSDQTPFADKKTQIWLSSIDQVSEVKNRNEQDEEILSKDLDKKNIKKDDLYLLDIPIAPKIKEQIVKLVKDKKLPKALELLNKDYRSNEDFRTYAYRQCLLAECYEKSNLPNLSKPIYQQLMNQVESMPIQEWESTFMQWISFKNNFKCRVS